jgi:ribokinase
MTTLAVVGSVNLDFVARASHLPAPGETVTGATLARHPGGKGANQALAARRLGAAVQLHARVGRDAMADEALALLRAEGADLSHCVAHASAPTGVALIAVSVDGENQIVVAAGANETFAPSGLASIETDVLLCQLEVPLATVEAASLAHRGFVSINLAPAAPLPQALLQRADLLIVNEGEAAFYGAELHKGVGLVAVTYGAKGAALFQSGAEVARIAAPKITPVDTTGAGDAFSAALTLAMVEGAAKEEALAFACAVGALTATKEGAQPSLPTRAEVDAFRARYRSLP